MKKIKKSKLIKWLKTRANAKKHLKNLFKDAIEEQWDEDDFFFEITQRGFNLLDIFLFAREYFRYSLCFMKEHGF